MSDYAFPSHAVKLPNYAVPNYAVMAHKPTGVTHSCVGKFTDSDNLNLIIAKCSRIEVHSLAHEAKGERLQCMLDVPIYGRIATLKLFHPHDEVKDFLFVATERYQYCVLQWDADKSRLITRVNGDLSNRLGRPPDNGQIGIIDPGCRLIGLHLCDGLFTVIPFGEKGELEQAFNIRLAELQVLDIKFLYGCSKPTIVVLFKDDKYACRVKTYEVDLKNKRLVRGPWKQKDLDHRADLLIPVRLDPYGFLIIGEQTIVYHFAANASRKIPISSFITKAYGSVNDDGSRYLLGDHVGSLHLLDINHEKESGTGIKIGLLELGKTSIASTISCLDNEVVYIGSSYGDSQLIKLSPKLDDKGSGFTVLESYVNLGPVVDFCVGRQGQVVTCSGAYKDGSLCIVYGREGIVITQQASKNLGVITGMWSLRSSTGDTFLVVSFLEETRIFKMGKNDVDMVETCEIEGFNWEAQTLFCHDSVFDQLLQVTSTSVKLINFDSKKEQRKRPVSSTTTEMKDESVSSTTTEMKDEWNPPKGSLVIVATANASQVLLATQRRDLFYLEISNKTLTKVSHIPVTGDISCLNISPTGKDPKYCNLAAVGMWEDKSVGIFSLPRLELKIKENTGVLARSVLVCSFEGISYLLCALGDGQLLNFLLNKRTGALTDRKELSLGTREIKLRTFSSNNTTHVFAASDRPTVIYSSNKRLRYSTVNLKEVSDVCPLNSVAYPDSLAIANGDQFMIGTILRSIPLGEHARHICYQEQSGTFAICSLKTLSNAKGSEEHFIRLLDDQTYDFTSTHPLKASEYGCSILSCSFSDDYNVYYCVGTAYVRPEENEPTEGRILVFKVEGKTLKLVAEKEIEGGVYSLNEINGKLLASINHKIQLYKWALQDDGTRELEFDCGYCGNIFAPYVRICGDVIVVGGLMESLSVTPKRKSPPRE